MTAISTDLPDIAAVDAPVDRRMWRENGLVVTVSLPWSDYRNGKTIGWCGPTKGGGWQVTILAGPRKGQYPTRTGAAAQHQLHRLTEGIVLR